MNRTRKSTAATWKTVREFASALPEAEESTSYGTPAFKVRGKLFVRFHQSGESVVILISIEEREALMSRQPDVFYITDHYTNWPYVLVRLSTVEKDDLKKLLEESWRRAAPKRLLAEYDNQP